MVECSDRETAPERAIFIPDPGASGAGLAFAFDAGVAPGDSGLLEIRASTTRFPLALIALGADRPFLESELPPSAGADGAFSQSEVIHFAFSGSTLCWSSPNVRGEVRLSHVAATLTVSLHLPDDNTGFIRQVPHRDHSPFRELSFSDDRPSS